jgi:SAM-dependent methyltransferase
VGKTLKMPWPTKAVMTQIYEQHFWGGKDFDFYSGFGSHQPEIITPYLEAVISFLRSHSASLTVCDLGCGDFNIGKHLVPFAKTYIAVDIVETLITRNKTLFKTQNLEFQCLDISKDDLPKADCAILRQVLQHLSNTEIQNILKQLKQYKYLIVTEHLPNGDFTPNLDIIAGQGIRIKKQSGVNILKPPFNFKIKAQKQLNEFVLDYSKGGLVTNLYQLY